MDKMIREEKQWWDVKAPGKSGAGRAKHGSYGML